MSSVALKVEHLTDESSDWISVDEIPRVVNTVRPILGSCVVDAISRAEEFAAEDQRPSIDFDQLLDNEAEPDQVQATFAEEMAWRWDR